MFVFGSNVGNRADEELQQGAPILWQTKSKFTKPTFSGGSKIV